MNTTTPLTARHVGRAAAALAATAILLTACSDTDDAAGPATSESTQSTTQPEPSDSALDTSEPCAYLASAITSELATWAGSDDVSNAPIGETRLGPQPDGGIPGFLEDGCVWEVRGPDGGHVGIAVERFVDVDMTQLAALAADAEVTPSALGDGRNRWDIPASDDSPSGAVLVGDAGQLVVIRVESYSDNADRTFIVDTLAGSDRFFLAVGNTLAESQPD